MAENDPNLVDYLTLAAAVLSPIAAAITTIWSIKRSDRERFDLGITWQDFGPNHRLGEASFLVVHNRSTSRLLIADIWLSYGAFLTKRSPGTIKYWEDPTDLHFPYEIEPNAVGRFMLSDYEVRTRYGKFSDLRKSIERLGRSLIWVGVTTGAGKKKKIGAEDMIPWKERPEWRKDH